jgi:type III secretion protein D
MKQLRILTGRHAGARLRLQARRYRIGAGDDADLQITDWQHAPVVLQVDEGAAATLWSADEAAQPLGTLADLSPRRFGDVALCIGEAEGPWPGDMELIARLMRPTPAAAPAAAKARGALPTGRRALIGMVLGSTALLAGFTTVVVRASNGASSTAPKLTLQARVWRAVEATHLPGIVVRPQGGQVIVEGLLSDDASLARLRSALQPFAAEPIVHRYAAATDVARSITEALGNPGLAASYRGQGVFVVDGSTQGLDKVREAAHRIATDLAPLVQRIDIAAAELPPPERVPVGAMLSTDGLQYVQTRDGTKHLALPPEPIRALAEPPAPSHPRSTHH